MPELPEVEVVRRQLESQLVGAAITRVASDHPRFRLERVTGRAIKAVRRRGKYLHLDLDDSRTITLHLGMTGQLRVGQKPHNHVHLSIHTDRVTLYFRDARRFGSARVYEAGQTPSGVYRDLGQEPLSRRFDVPAAVVVLADSDAPIKGRLLSQRAVAGVGNYIADEALHRAGIHPARRAIGPQELEDLVCAVLAVVRESVRHGGVSERDYMHIDGGAGSYQVKLRCYGRAGLDCITCKTALKKTVVAGRGSTFCPRCQKL
jgi:formamidopyrimidine-DNA glycosylase